MHERFVLLRIDLNFEKVSGRARSDTRDDLDRLAGRQLAIHARCRYADSLLTPTHTEPVKFRTVEQLCEDARDMLANDARTIVRHRDAEPSGLACRWRRPVSRHDFQPDHDIRENTRFFAGIERVINGFLHTGQ